MFENSLRVSTTALGVSVLCAVILAQNFFPQELSSPFIVLLGLSIMVFGKIQRSYLKLVWPLFAVLTIGLIGVSDHDSRHILRDVAFALTPIALIFMGYWIADNKGMWPVILKVIVICSFVSAFIHLSAFAQNPALLSADISDVRKTVGGTSDLVVLAFVLGVFQKRLGINNLFPRLLPRFVVIPVLFASFVLSYSRTELMVAIIVTLSMLGWASRINSRFVLVFLLMVCGFGVIVLVTPADEVGTFRSHLARSLTEITISNYQDPQDISDNWRGFETYRAVETYLSGSALNLVMGQGFGSLVDLGIYIPLGGDVDFHYIPITHNGYVYILLKTGLLGLFCYAFFYINVIRYALRYSHSTNTEQKLLARLLLGCVLSLIAIMYVVGGMAEMHGSELVLLLGYLVHRLWQFQSVNRRIGVMGTGL